jgi:hypothetical protein
MKPAACHIVSLAIVMFAGCSAPQKQPEPKPASAAPPKIVHFYASPGVVPPGEPFLMCYGVENARTVKLSPPVERITPSLNRCISVTARAATTYTLTAENDAGTVTESLAIKMGAKTAKTAEAPAPQPSGMIQLFISSATEITAGQQATLCYGVNGAKSARIEPQLGEVPALEKHCVRVGPHRTTTYTLIATSADGQSDREKLTITVKP